MSATGSARAACAAALAALLAGCRDPRPWRAPAAPDAAGAAVREAAAPGPGRPRLDVAGWMRLGRAELACELVRAGAGRDAQLDGWCRGAAGENPAPRTLPSDPCEDLDGWRAGPSVPDALAPRLHPALRHVELAWEGGRLQRAAFAFAAGTSGAAMAAALGDAGGALDGAARHGPGACDGPCWEVLVFEPSFFECADDEEDDDADEAAD